MRCSLTCKGLWTCRSQPNRGSGVLPLPELGARAWVDIAWTQPREPPMRIVLFALASATLLLSACGSTREQKTVVVSPPAGSTVVVPPDGEPKVIPPGH